MIVIVEGPDGSGKSTLCAQLVDILGPACRYKHFSYPKDKQEADNLLYTYSAYLRNSLIEGGNTVIDRMWPSTMVYGEVLRGNPEIAYRQALELEASLCGHAIMIYCTGDPEDMWHRCVERGEDYVTGFKEFYSICRKYDEVMLEQKHLIPVFTYTIPKEG